MIVEKEAKPWHCGRMSRTVRHEHAKIMQAMQANIHRELRQTFDASALKRAFYLDGDLVALAGVRGTMGESTGEVWFVTTDEMSVKHPLVIARAALKFMDRVMLTRQGVATGVFADDKPGVRLAYFLGFSVDRRQKIGGREIIHMSCVKRKAA
jgi:hypothetical protein